MRRVHVNYTLIGASILAALSAAGFILLAAGAAVIYLSALIPISATGAVLMFTGQLRLLMGRLVEDARRRWDRPDGLAAQIQREEAVYLAGYNDGAGSRPPGSLR